MFLNKQFYHKHIKKAITAFGMVFNNININRENSEGEVQQVLRVPLAYSTKQKFLSRIALIDDASNRGEIAITLPRMGFEIQQLEFDSSRKISPIQKNKAVAEGESVLGVRQTFVSAPYNMSLSLYVFAKNQEDGLQIIEQILPFFTPDFTITVNELPELGIKRDIKITLDNIDYSDEYEGEYAERTSIIWTLNFTMRLNFYGYVSDQNIIRESIVNAYNSLDNENAQGIRATATIQATGDVDPATALDPHDLIIDLTDF